MLSKCKPLGWEGLEIRQDLVREGGLAPEAESSVAVV